MPGLPLSAEQDAGSRARRAAGTSRAPAREAGRGAGKGRRLVCARCRHPITHERERIEIDGLHERSQVNPHGFVWTFGCWARAPGCDPVGPPSTEFTWFPGHSWQIEQCAGCGAHMGWLFRGPERSFHGLICDRLVPEERSRAGG
ncbi:MAG TPA: cereblon family protein [Kofleriaceae bacterium]|nr:cereblon family protein [Kofleriaceae bacterium]